MLQTSNTPVEALLERHLAPVTAPRELWERVRYPSQPRPSHEQQVPRKLAWALAALLAFAAAVSSLRTPQSIAANEAAAFQALARETGDLEFQSGKAAEIRAWVHSRTGIDVAIPENPDSRVRLLGAHVAPAGTLEIAYSVGDRRAALVVSKAASSGLNNLRHRELSREPNQSRRTYSWTLDGQQYTLACAVPGELQAACLLCHADSQWQTAVN